VHIPHETKTINKKGSRAVAVTEGPRLT